jgi:FkbM family methyltransferase
VIDPAEIAAARNTLETAARLGLKDRAERVGKVNDLASQLKAEVSEHTYAVDQLFQASGGAAMTVARELLDECQQALVRCYPPAPQAGSLHEEDEILADLVPGITGAYVDIGAWRPAEQSNTWQFYRKGWRGVLVEPVSAAWPALLYQRPGDCLVPWAVSNRKGHARLEVSGPTSQIRDCHNGFCDWTVVETRTLAETMDLFPYVRDHCRLCSIDVEGHEREVLEGNDWDAFRPDVLCIEYKDHVDGSDSSGKWIDLITAQGYVEKARTENNIIFQIRQVIVVPQVVETEVRAAVEAPPNGTVIALPEEGKES